MRLLLQLLGTVIGLAVIVVGLPGVNDAVTTWSEDIGGLHAILSNPGAYFCLTLFGAIVLALSWADIIAEWRISHAGGVNHKEFRVRLNPWDRVNVFATWQVAWLWNDLEPLATETSGTPAYPTFRRLKEDLNAGKIEGAAKVEGSWKDSGLQRQSLIDYAIALGERPRFLFPSERSPFKRIARRILDREMPVGKIREYGDLGNVYIAAYSSKGMKQTSVETITAELQGILRTGEAVAIGRPKRNGLLFPYQEISRRRWKKIALQPYSDVTDGRDTFSRLKIKFIKQSQLRLSYRLAPGFPSLATRGRVARRE